MVQPMVGLAPFEPINSVTPFTYRDNSTYLTILKGIQDKVNELTEYANSIAAADSDNLNAGLNGIRDQFNAQIKALQIYLENLIAGSHDEGIAFDPTNGTYLEGVSTVISRVYDNVRVFAYFARQYDDFGWTAKEYDDKALVARHFDLGIMYPVLNDVQK